MPHKAIEALESRQFLSAAVPAGFQATTAVTGLTSPTAEVYAPDGRLFVTEQGGDVRVVKNGVVQPTPFVSLDVNSQDERGLLGIALDPRFADNGYVYVYYTATTPTIHNRVSRFTASGDTAVAGSEVDLLDLPQLGPTNHNGGALLFGADGMLYIGVGDNGFGERSANIETPFGKILRIAPDGSIPTDNPFFGQTTDINQAIWAKGLRNPFTLALSPNGTLVINDVGEGSWEEVNIGVAGADYGWNSTEGPTTAAGITAPIYAYPHSGKAAAIIGGAFLSDGGYYFGDLLLGFVRRLDISTGAVTNFATGIDAVTDFDRAPDGSLDILQLNGNVTRISGPFGVGPTVTIKAPTTPYVAGKPVKFSFSAKDIDKKATPVSGFSYHADLISGDTVRPLVAETAGKKSAAIVPPTDIVDTSAIVRLTLTVTGKNGGITTTTRDVQPNVRTVTARTSLAGVFVTPMSYTAIAGTTIQFTTPSDATASGVAYLFKNWKGAKPKTTVLNFVVPVKDTTLTANYIVNKHPVN